MIEKVKLMLGLAEASTEVTEKINFILDGAKNQLLSYINSKDSEVPEELEYIVVELAIIRYNRLGNEGMTNFSQDGESMAFNTKDIEPYMPAISAYNQKQGDSSIGVVRFL